MKKTLLILIALLAVTAVATFALAGEPEKFENHIKLVLNVGDEPIELEAEDLAVGESREFQTDSGKPVVLTRAEEGLEVTVDGKKINLFGHGPGHGFFHAGDATKVFVAHAGEGEEAGHHFSWVEGEGHGDGPHVVKIRRHGGDTAKRLLESGALDGLDESTRERILEELRKIDAEPRIKIGKEVIVLDGDEVEGETKD